MTKIDELQALVDKMTDEGKWRVAAEPGPDYFGKMASIPGVAVCDPLPLHDARGIVALRNAAPALLECARLLRWLGEQMEIEAVDAALKRLEES